MQLMPKVKGEVQRDDLTLSNAITPFGCCNFFDNCGGDIFGLFWSGQLPLLDALGFNPTNICYRTVEFITYNRPEQIDGECSPGYLSNPCEPPNGFEIGSAKITVEDFGRIGREGPVRDITKTNVVYCKTSPRYTLNGVAVTSEDLWDQLFALDQVLADISKMVINGNATTAGMFDGLQRWVSTVYGPMLNSYVVDWNGNDMGGGAGITINGTPIAATFDMVDVLLSLMRRINQRIKWSAMLRNQRPRIGDFFILLPTHALHCLLDFYTCWSVCEGQQYNEVNLNSYEARAFRDGLIAQRPENIFGDGFIRLDGVPIPLMAYDWEMVNPDGSFDMYFLTPAYGSFRIWEGEHLNADDAVRSVMASSGSGYTSRDGGRVLVASEFDNLCKKTKLWMFPRLFCKAPWLQMRFQNVVCADVLDPLSPDPCGSFYPMSSFSAAECP
jgi:hypothetical protein